MLNTFYLTDLAKKAKLSNASRFLLGELLHRETLKGNKVIIDKAAESYRIIEK